MVYRWRSLFLLVSDTVLLGLSLWFSLWIRFDGGVPEKYYENFGNLLFPYILVFLGAFFFFGMYRRAWAYASIGEALALAGAVTAGSLGSLIVSLVWFPGPLPFPRSFWILNWILAVVLAGGSRFVWRLFRDYGLGLKKKKKGSRVLIAGAGAAGVLVAKELKSHYNGGIRILGFVDDDPLKQKVIVQGIPVLGTSEEIPALAAGHKIQEIIIAMPSAAGKAKRRIVALGKETGAKVKILPGVYDLIDGRVKISRIRDVDVEDLLGRDPVKVDLDGIAQYIRGQVVLVTGGGGSIGSELCRQIASYNPKALLILDACENNVYEIDLELKKAFPDLHIVSLVKDVRDRRSVIQAFKAYRPQVVFHAAAHKHVPMMEYNPEDAIKNNVMGTYHVAQVADMFKAKKFVLISTDKAVNPTSFMGASKRLAELVVQYLDTVSETSYVAVRFGNVLGSAGSVLPLFKKQIAEGGPVTVTHPAMVRFFMTIPEAVQLVIQAGAMAKGGEIFVLDMGEPVKIMDLARSLIELSGLEPGKDIDIKITGTRPGEKLYEELLTAEEGVTATTHKRIFVARPGALLPDLIEEKIIARIVSGSLPQTGEQALEMVREFLPGFKEQETGTSLPEEPGGQPERRAGRGDRETGDWLTVQNRLRERKEEENMAAKMV
ncbi:polysaccharide biosynthesis protein [Candidatus Formimonas warabiya]|uniref:Polysaccharide biosynthesis protein CapD-like domain-containing protein n=1 Tax=Formimonas warabiya TaxID=1761012 RepID=A0A3G1KPX8_FORW1|nr:nucleoside-diphosphate sugar epimerase/dehydratase [Candidatus Formimonas warabiya]ATW24514.1 hypothetical protein DCMF_06730 [Candidatus Formimonas warabiya]